MNQNQTSNTVLVGRGGKLYRVDAVGNRAERVAFVAGQSVGTTVGILWAPLKVVGLAAKEALDGAANTSFGQGMQYGFNRIDRAVDVQVAAVRNRGKDIQTIKMELAASKVLSIQEINNLSESALRKVYSDSQVPDPWELPVNQASAQPVEESRFNSSVQMTEEHSQPV